MRGRFFWWPASGLGLILAVLPCAHGLAGEAEKAEAPSAAKEAPAAAEKPAGLVGTVVAAVSASRTLVVDVPLGKEVLRVGAEITEKTKITAAGKSASFESLKPGARVRINFRRVETGDEALSVEVLQGAKR